MTLSPELRGRDPWIDRLSEFLDGEMPERERNDFERHLADCPVCAVTLADLRAVVTRAHELVDTPPAEDLWPGIAAKIAQDSRATRRAPAQVTADSSWWRRRFAFELPQLAAAGVLLMALTAGGVWVAMNRTAQVAGGRASIEAERGKQSTSMDARPPATSPSTESQPGIAAPGASGRSADATAALAGYGGPGYDAAIAELEQTLAAGRGRLDPKTLRVVEQNLRIIDRAVEQARRAVEADPGNTWLRSYLASTMRRKAELLRTANMLAAAQG